MRQQKIMIWCILVMLLFSISIVTAQNEPYRDASLPVEERVADLLSRMTLEEMLGQMTLVEKNSITAQSVENFFIGGVLSGGGGYPSTNTPEAWAEMVDTFQSGALATRLGIPLIYGVDAVHGHNNVYGATIFPHNIGLGATRNSQLLSQIGRITAEEMIATGIYWNYAPVLAAPQDIRWGRTYEGYSENYALVDELGNAFIIGLQGQLGDSTSVLATAKHYIGDGATTWGTSPEGSNHIDRGDTRIDEETLRSRDLLPYITAIDKGVLSIMVSFSSWNGSPMHANDYLLTDVLKNELGFRGFLVSDWGGIDLISDDYYEAVVMAINAGVDMNMVPYNYVEYLDVMTQAVENGDISMERIHDAVSRILTAKFEMGLFDHPYSNPDYLDDVGSEAHRAVAQQAVSESLVLLRNEDDTLPITNETNVIFVAGEGADNIGFQSGGWTIEWGGSSGAITEGTTILEGIETLAGDNMEVHYNSFGRFNNVTDEIRADVGIMVVSEFPYVEWEGDSAFLDISNADRATFMQMREQSEKLVLIVLSGRPVVITDLLLQSDAVVAAWLPGTEGQGVADVLFGNVPFTGRLSYTWLRTIDQIPFDFTSLPDDGCDAPLFPYGYGLSYGDSSSDWIDLAIACDS